MKKFCLTVSLLGMVLPVLGASSQMAMVSYFPIPYVTYQNVYVHKQLDVGLGSQCEWNVGNSSLSSVPLTATTLNLYGTLNLQNIATLNTTGTSTVTLGVDPSGTEDIKLSFSNLRVETSDRFLNINATDVLELTSGRTDKGLFVYPDVIKEPGKIMSGCEDGVSWQRITEKDGKDGVYLVCGAMENSPPPCSPPDGKQYYTTSCPTGYYGVQVYTWNTSTCNYQRTTLNCYKMIWVDVSVGSCAYRYRQWDLSADDSVACTTNANEAWNNANNIKPSRECENVGEQGKLIASNGRNVGPSDGRLQSADYKVDTPNTYPFVCWSPYCYIPTCERIEMTE